MERISAVTLNIVEWQFWSREHEERDTTSQSRQSARQKPCFRASNESVRFGDINDALLRAYDDVGENHTLQMAAALSYYFVLSLFPALILLSAIVTYLPVPDLFGQALALMSHFVPPDGMGLVRKVLSDVVKPNRGALLSVGLVGTLWSASGGFSAAIEALNIAYDAQENRALFGSLVPWRLA